MNGRVVVNGELGRPVHGTEGIRRHLGVSVTKDVATSSVVKSRTPHSTETLGEASYSLLVTT